MKLTDEIEGIVYRNEDNGYSVLRLKDCGLTAVGTFHYVTVGQEFTFDGEFIENAKYGKQFKVKNYELVPPDSPAKIRAFIGSGLIEGVGPATAARIVKTFGKETLKILESERVVSSNDEISLTRLREKPDFACCINADAESVIITKSLNYLNRKR